VCRCAFGAYCCLFLSVRSLVVFYDVRRVHALIVSVSLSATTQCVFPYTRNQPMPMVVHCSFGPHVSTFACPLSCSG
jgi:hypothetical protein